MNKQLVAVQSERASEVKEREELVAKKMQQEIEKINQEHEHQKHMLYLQVDTQLHW